MQRVCMAVILLAACWFDIRYRKIPNGLILTGWAISLVLAGWQQGLKGLSYSMAGILAVVAAGFPLYWCRAVGAGDVKLLSVLAGIHGLRRSVQVFATGIPLAAAAGLLILAGSASGIGKRVPDGWKRLLSAREGVGTEAERTRPGRHRLILAPFFAVAYFRIW